MNDVSCVCFGHQPTVHTLYQVDLPAKCPIICITGTCLDAFQKANGLEILHSTALQAHAG